MTRDKELTHQLNVKIDGESLNRLNEVAEKLGFTKSDLARRALMVGVERFSKVRLPGLREQSEALK